MKGEKRQVKVDYEPVELFKILKFQDLVMSGGEAKHVISQGLVRVNGEIETRKTKKIYVGDRIDFQGVCMTITLGSGQ
ncbi:MAG: RNA-binding S4 domain-containing protein [Pseudomonadota bacterium]